MIAIDTRFVGELYGDMMVEAWIPQTIRFPVWNFANTLMDYHGLWLLWEDGWKHVSYHQSKIVKKNKVSAGSSLYMSIQYIYIIWVNILWKSHAHNLHVRPGYDGRWRLRGAVQSPHPTAGSAPGPYQRLPLRSQHLLQWRSPSLPHEGSLPNVQMVKTQSKSIFLLGNFKTWMWIRLSGLTFYNVWHFFWEDQKV